jgi:hypothetical protein
MNASFLTLALLSGQSAVFASDDVPHPDEATESYALSAALIDTALIGAGFAVTVTWTDPTPSPYEYGFNYGPLLMGVASVTGGMLTHSLYGNPKARWKSLGLRAGHMGKGALVGFGSGIALGAGTMGVCGLTGGGFCSLALVYGAVFGPVIGGTIGLGRGVARDYRTLARRPLLTDGTESSPLQPMLNVTPEGELQFGVSGGF